MNITKHMKKGSESKGKPNGIPILILNFEVN